MTVIDELQKLDSEQLSEALHMAAAKLDAGDGDLVLDFSAQRRLDPSALKSLEELASRAEQKSMKLTLRGVNVDIYKVLKLARLASRFTFLN